MRRLSKAKLCLSGALAVLFVSLLIACNKQSVPPPSPPEEEFDETAAEDCTCDDPAKLKEFDVDAFVDGIDPTELKNWLNNPQKAKTEGEELHSTYHPTACLDFNRQDAILWKATKYKFRITGVKQIKMEKKADGTTRFTEVGGNPLHIKRWPHPNKDDFGQVANSGPLAPGKVTPRKPKRCYRFKTHIEVEGKGQLDPHWYGHCAGGICG